MENGKEEEEEEENKQKNLLRRRIAATYYKKENELRRQKSYTSFGSTVLAREKAFPIYSIGRADRSVMTGEFMQLPQSTPGPNYSPPDEAYYKFKYSPKWRIGHAERQPILNGEKFTWYDNKYDEKNDVGKYPKKWRNHLMGGALPLEPRNVLDIYEKNPGPGRYDPNIKAIKPKDFTYVIGEKDPLYSSLTDRTGTDRVVGPGTYHIEDGSFTSKHHNFPKWSIGNEKRKGLCNKGYSTNQTYCDYSSIGSQIITRKRSEPNIHIGRSTRDGETFRGVLPSHMDKIPTKVNLDHPKF